MLVLMLAGYLARQPGWLTAAAVAVRRDVISTSRHSAVHRDFQSLASGGDTTRSRSAADPGGGGGDVWQGGGGVTGCRSSQRWAAARRTVALPLPALPSLLQQQHPGAASLPDGLMTKQQPANGS